MVKNKEERKVKKRKYGFFGNSAVQICLWTRKSLKNEGVCWKEKFYGINCHRCMQFTPIVKCQQNCVFCWRPKELLKKIKKEIENPDKIISQLIEERKRLLSGYPGFKKLNRIKFAEALIPNHFSISLIGEPTLYKKLPEMIKLLREKYKAKSIFLVTNGQEPEMLKKLKSDKLPDHLTISIVAGNEKKFLMLSKPLYKNSWERLLKSLKILKNLKCRKVIRINIIRKINDSKKDIREFSEMIEIANPNFLHLKAYMWLGSSRKILKEENMPSHDDIKKFSKELLKFLKNFKFENESKDSRVVLLKNKANPWEEK